MVRTLAAIVFIAGVGGGAVYLSQKKTVIRGDVMAGELLEHQKAKGISEITCDDSPVDAKGAVFICRVAATDGSRATIEYTMDREGNTVGKQLGDTSFDRGPAEAPERERTRDPGGDPWGQ